MSPRLVTAPTAATVSLSNLKAHLRVDFNDDDALITSLERAAVGYLDGWTGILGRAINEQTWEETFSGWGTLRLSMPDVSEITVTGTDANGDPVAATSSELLFDARGPYVECEGPAVESVTVEYVCAMPEPQAETARQLVKLLVGHWYQNREAVGPSVQAIPMAVETIATSMRWSLS